MTYASKAQKALELENAALKRQLDYWKAKAEAFENDYRRVAERLADVVTSSHLPDGRSRLDLDTAKHRHD